jgi:hypothetical protein
MKRIILIFTVLAMSIPAVAQVQAGGTASAVYYQHGWNMGTELTPFQVPIFYAGAQKNNIFSVGQRDVVVPGAFELYGGLLNYQPDLTPILSKMNFNADQVSLSIDFAGGVATLPNGTTKPGLEGRLNFQVALTPATSFTGGYAGGGLIGQDQFYTISAGLSHQLFGTPSATPSAAKRAFNRVYALKHRAQ